MINQNVLTVMAAVAISALGYYLHKKKKASKEEPTSVNYHFTRECNYSCGFCFHTAKTSFVLSIEEAKRGLRLLKNAGMKKINFAGGEPFLRPKFLGELAQYCKQELRLESVSIVSNGSKITGKWMDEYGQYIDILAVSVDSFDEATNIKIGRGTGKHLQNLTKIRDWCSSHNIKFKINTVVNAYNWDQDLNEQISHLKPHRWKVFQVLVIEGENDGNNTKRDATEFKVSNAQFNAFLSRHQSQPSLVPEDNTKMRSSYIILDEYMRFLDCSKGKKTPSSSILKVGVEMAMKETTFDREMFVERGGMYEWSRNTTPSCASQQGDRDIEDLVPAKLK